MSKNIEKTNLIESIKSLTKNYEKDTLLNIVLGELDEEQLATVLHVLLDPNYHTNESIFVSPKRFTKNADIPNKQNVMVHN